MLPVLRSVAYVPLSHELICSLLDIRRPPSIDTQSGVPSHPHLRHAWTPNRVRVRVSAIVDIFLKVSQEVASKHTRRRASDGKPS